MKTFTQLATFGVMFGVAAAHLPAQAQQYAAMTPAIIEPAAGATVPSPVTVSYGVSPADTGQNSSNAVTPPSSGHHRKLHAYLVIDSAVPAAGVTLQPDADHVAFPVGQRDVSVALAPGHHELQIVFVNKAGQVSRHIPPSAPVSISVK
jgi:hypothetical protein